MLRQFFDYYRPHMRLFWLDFGSAVLSGLLELAFPLAVAGFIDHLLPQGDFLGRGERYTNADLMVLFDPTNSSIPYVYDNFRWAHCDSQGFGFYNYGR